MQVSYEWNVDNTVAERTEYDNTGESASTAVTTFGYDHRKRLISEVRVVDSSTTVYDFEYEYDQLGNRLTKADAVNHQIMAYDYDVNHDLEEEGWDYPTRNNRLLSYAVTRYDNSWSSPALLRTVSYVYWSTGTCSNIIVKDEYIEGVTPGSESAYDWYSGIALYYSTNDSLWRVLWDKWKLDGEGESTDYTRLAAREFFYDSGRARYMSRAIGIDDYWLPLPPVEMSMTDYSGDEPYADWTLSLDEYYDETVSETRQYLSGMGVQAGAPVSPTTQPAAGYLHGDLIRSTILVTNDSGAPASQPAPASGVATFAYTAFGELVGNGPIGQPPEALATRYLYAGGWGYEAGQITLAGPNSELGPIQLHHVGARWYDPDVGRFVQRDPIGLSGGLNTYLYSRGNALPTVDPGGLSGFNEAEDDANREIWRRMHAIQTNVLEHEVRFWDNTLRFLPKGGRVGVTRGHFEAGVGWADGEGWFLYCQYPASHRTPWAKGGAKLGPNGLTPEVGVEVEYGPVSIGAGSGGKSIGVTVPLGPVGAKGGFDWD